MPRMKLRAEALALGLVLAAGCNGSSSGTPVAETDASSGGSPAPVTADAAASSLPSVDAGPSSGPLPSAADGSMPGGGGAGGAAAPSAGPDTTVSGFSGAHVYFAGMDNKRKLDAMVTFPEMPLAYERITLTLTLRCPPAGGCDPWDRRAHLGVVRGAGETESVLEILRFMTPYGVGARWSVDVTALRPLLSGSVNLRLFIDTWVGPGHPPGAGWLVDASFEMKGGVPERLPVAVLPLWDEREVDYGDPAKAIATSVPAQMVTLPAGTRAVELRSFVTGHGQGNLDNCAEFCSRKHTFTVGGMAFARDVWRPDCARTAAPGQHGTFMYPRAGWCPGADVIPWVEDVTAAALAAGGGPLSVSYDVASYENSCRPGAMPCGCGAGCAYNDGGHTRPVYVLSSVLVAYR
jgi:hypothetical protein